MAGYAFKQLANFAVTPPVSATPYTLFTVPAGHTYIIKKGRLFINRTGAGATTMVIERSDTAGANFRRCFDTLITGGPAGGNTMNLTLTSSGTQNNNPMQLDSAAGAIYSTLENLICEAGTILRITPTLGGAASTMEVALDGVDYTL